MHRVWLIAGIVCLCWIAVPGNAQDVEPALPQDPPGEDQPQPPPPDLPTPPPADDQEQPQPAPVPVPLPTPQQLIVEFRETCGDPEKIASLRSVSIKANLPLPTGETHFDVQSMRSGAFRFTQRGVQQPGVSVYFDGKNGWVEYSSSRRELIDDFTLQRARHQFNAMFPYWHVLFADERFHAMETLELTKFNEHECYKVRLHDEESRNMQRFAYFDANEKIMRGTSVTQDTPTGPVAVEFKFDEWTQVEGVKVFTKLSIEQPTQPMMITYSHVEFNTVDPSLFQQPVDVQAMIAERDAPPPAPIPSDAPQSDDASPDDREQSDDG